MMRSPTTPPAALSHLGIPVYNDSYPTKANRIIVLLNSSLI